MKRSIVLLLIAFGPLTQAQKLADSNVNLDSLSHEYLKVGDNYCLVIDAVKDGLINPNGSYDIQFSHKLLTINGKTATPEMSARYLAKIKQLNKYRGIPDNDRYNYASINGSGGVSINEPQPYVSADAREKQTQKRNYASTLLIDKLLADNLIYSRELTIRHSDDGIWVNNRKLSLKQERKYMPLIAQLDSLDKIDYVAPALAVSKTHHDGFISLKGF